MMRGGLTEVEGVSFVEEEGLDLAVEGGVGFVEEEGVDLVEEGLAELGFTEEELVILVNMYIYYYLHIYTTINWMLPNKGQPKLG